METQTNEYTCSSCKKIANGFHECNNIVEKNIKTCGCESITKVGFMSLTSVYREKWTETTLCKKHTAIKNRKQRQPSQNWRSK